jgi:penicillin-binding protein 2
MVRTKLANFVILAIFSILTLGLINLDIVGKTKYKALSDKNSLRLLPQMGARGRIFDRNQEIILDNTLSYDVMVLPQDLKEFDKTLIEISKVLNQDLKYLKEQFKHSYVASSLSVVLANNIGLKKAMALEESKLNFPGIIIQPNPKRIYPHGRLAVHLLGYLNEIDRWRLTKLADYGYKTKDIVGFGGIEERFDYYLRQEEGGLSFEVDHRGRSRRVLGFRSAVNGKDLQLTLDLRIQKIVEDKLKERTGCVIIMDPYMGEILAMASYPNFDPQIFIDKNNAGIANFLNDPDAPMVNRAISGVYPPGSLFKIIVATAALETKKINLSTSFFCNGSMNIGGKEFNCWSIHNQQTLIPAISHSCNVFFYNTGILTGAQAIHDYAVKFGLSKPANFELSYESSGFIPSPLWRQFNKFSRQGGIPFLTGKKWYKGDTANLSIGQGDCLVTPLQMARMIAVFANKGYLVTPYIVKSIDGKVISGNQRKRMDLSLKESTVNNIREGLRRAISDPGGTGFVLSDLSVPVAGKTGTAQAPPGQPHAWFVGFFPYNNPKYVICVFLERGGPGYLSCVLAKQIIEDMIKENLI